MQTQGWGRVGWGGGRRKGKEEEVGETLAMGDGVGVACSLRAEDGVSLCWRKKRKKLILGVASTFYYGRPSC